MKFLALIYVSESAPPTNTDDPNGILPYMAYEEWLAKERPGKRLGGDALMPTATARTIRIRDGKTTVTDGPFAETKEHLGGYYMFEAADIAEAVSLAEGIPGAKSGCVEVRPIMVWEP